MTVPLAWLGELGAVKFAQGVAGCCLLYGGPAPCLLPAPQPPAPAMTDPSACKTTIALISGGGRAASGHPGLQAPSSSWASLHQGQGSHGGGGREVRGQRSPVSHDEVGVFLHLRGPRCEGYPAEPPSPTVAISKPQPLFLPEAPTALAPTSPAPQGPRLGGWRLRVWLPLDLV